MAIRAPDGANKLDNALCSLFSIYALPILDTDAHIVLCDAIAKVERCSNLQEVSRKKKSRRETKLMRRRV